MSKITELKERPELLLETLYPDDAADGDVANLLDIDKTWNIIDYLLNLDSTDEDSPLVNAVMGGTELSDEDLGYGPARYLDQAEVAQLDSSLNELPAGLIWARYEPERAERDEVYWSNEEEGKVYFESNYEALRRFVHAAASAGEGIILWLA